MNIEIITEVSLQGFLTRLFLLATITYLIVLFFKKGSHPENPSVKYFESLGIMLGHLLLNVICALYIEFMILFLLSSVKMISASVNLEDAILKERPGQIQYVYSKSYIHGTTLASLTVVSSGVFSFINSDYYWGIVIPPTILSFLVLLGSLVKTQDRIVNNIFTVKKSLK